MTLHPGIQRRFDVSEVSWVVKTADVFQVAGTWRVVGRISIALLCGLTTGPWLMHRKKAHTLQKQSVTCFPARPENVSCFSGSAWTNFWGLCLNLMPFSAFGEDPDP